MPDYLLLRTDLLVLGLAVTLYLVDSGRLISTRELLLAGTAGGGWRAITPDRGFLFNRRHAVFPGLLDPGTALVRLSWPAAPGDTDKTRTAVQDLVTQLALPRRLCRVLFLLVFIGLPVAYYVPKDRLALGILFLTVYASVLLLAVWLFIRRRALGLKLGATALLAFEIIVCLPYAPNLHRKLFEKAWHARERDPLAVGAALLSEPAQDTLTEYLKSASDRMTMDAPGLEAWQQRLGQSS
ncbi:MAG: hypothetical protein AAFS02_12305 [Pseudomonadota bacterium]